MSSVKQLKINPDFFKLSSRTKKYKKKAKLPSSLLNRTIKPNDIKKKLLQRIKEHQKKNRDEVKQNIQIAKNTPTFHNEFKESLTYLNSVIKENKKKRSRKNKTQKNQRIDPDNLYIPNKEPPYGCLKGGRKPTYKQYQNTLKKDISPTIAPSIPLKIRIEDKPPTMNDASKHLFRKNKLKQVREKLASKFTNPFKGIQIPAPPPNKLIKKRNKTFKRKIILGKIKNAVGVLIKNKKTRKKIKDDINVQSNTYSIFITK